MQCCQCIFIHWLFSFYLDGMISRKQWQQAGFMALVVFCLYSSLFCFRKAFNVASFAGFSLFGLPYKTVLVITQMLGYMASKFYGISFIASLKRIGRGRLILLLAGIAAMSWLIFALIPPPYGFWCLLFNGFPLGMLWGVVFSYVEGRKMTDLISAALAVSFIFGSGLAKSVGNFLMQSLALPEHWMPFTTCLIFALPLYLFTRLADRFPAPDKDDVLLRTERKPMGKDQRRNLLKQYGVGLLFLVLIYVLVTILRELRDSFMADMWRESGQSYNSAVFAQTETIITVVMLLLVASMVFVKDSWVAFSVTHGLLLLGFVCSLLATRLYQQGLLSTWWWMLSVGLGLYMVYIPFNSILFDRFIASFRIAGNVGFLIYLSDSFGYLGSVAVMLTKNLGGIQMSWLGFYQQLVVVTNVVGVVCTLVSLWYFRRKKRQHNERVIPYSPVK